MRGIKIVGLCIMATLLLLTCAWPVIAIAMPQAPPPPRYGGLYAPTANILIYATPNYVDAGLYLYYLPDLEEAPVAVNGKPTEVYVGIQHGFSMPIWNADDEELFFNIVVPSFWDGETDIVAYCDVSIDTANTDKNFNLVLDWEHWSPDYDTVPSTNTTVAVERATSSGPQYQSYKLQFDIDYDINGAGNEIEAGDILTFRLRRLDASADEIAGEVVVHRTEVSFRRGDIDEFVTGDIIAATYVSDEEVEELAVEIAEQVDLFAMLVQLGIVIILGALAFWRGHFFLYILGGAAAMGWGIYYSSQGASGDTIYLTLGIVVAAAGLFMLFRSGMILLRR